MVKKPVSSADAELFRQSIGSVCPVKKDTVLPTTNKKPSPRPRTLPQEQDNPLQVAVNSSLELLSNEDRVEFLVPGMQKNVLKKLRKGFYGLDADLDLHGLTSREAQRQLIHFLQDCVSNGCRCVHIIHGKGYRSANNLPVLKNDLNLWLRQHRDVLAFCSTPPRDGGTGALFVLLRLSEKYGKQDETEY